MAEYEDRILRVIQYIHDNPAGDLSLDALADVAAMSRFHWHRVFRAMTGETCAAAVRRIRLHRAAQGLIHTDRAVAEIAAACGYPVLASFSRAFSEAYGLSPAAFRGRGALVLPPKETDQGGSIMFPIEIIERPACRIVALAHKGAYHEIGRSFEQLSSMLTARQAWPQVQGMLAIYYDPPDDVAESDLRSHAGFVVEEGAVFDAPLEEVQVPGGRHAVMHYKGPYSGLAKAYNHIYCDWLKTADVTLGTFPPFEVYLNSPMDTAPDALLTDICVPLV